MSIARARYAAKVLGSLFLGEAGRAAGLGRRLPPGEGHDRQQQRARAVRHALETLGPFYIKVGQMLSTRPDIVPQYMITELEHLHARVSVRPFSEFEPVLEEGLGRDWRRYFAGIDSDAPLGAASLAQVYGVTLRSGELAVVKIQRPGLARTMLDDMAVLERAMRMVAKRFPDFADVIDLEGMVETLFQAMRPELDFELEARNMEEFRERVDGFETLAIPEVVFQAQPVLVQTLAPGTSIRDFNRDKLAQAQREAIGRDLLAFMYHGFFVDGRFHADPHPGNIFVSEEGQAYLLDWGMIGRVDRRQRVALALFLLSFAMNDGAGMGRSWVELGKATSWADLTGFMNDLSRFVPTVVGASMGDLNLGVALTSVLKYSTRRGIQAPPAVAILGKAFANIDGSVRNLAPELSLVAVFKEEFTSIMFQLARDLLSQEQAFRYASEVMLSALDLPGQLRVLARDTTNREVTLRAVQDTGKRSHREAREDARAKALRRTAVALGAAALWQHHRSLPR